MSSKIAPQKKTAVPVLVAVPALPAGEFTIVLIAAIDPSPFNYRKVFPAQKMEELASSIALHGIIENLTLRRMPSGRYELVAGERRLRAAKMAGLTEVPAIIKDLTDEQVREIQLTENLQREDPHPLEEAGAIGQMQAIYKTIDEIALRLGKSKTFVYSRLKLLSLIPDIQEMFIAEKLTMQEVLEIAALSPQSQQDFYSEYCADWQQDDFDAPELSYVLNRYKYDLTAAPFNTKDKKLLPDVGACTQCPYNTATLTSLFPEEAKAATCTNTGCYQRKCQAHFSGNLRAALQEHQPAALLFYGSPSPLLKYALQELPEAAALPQYNYYGITRLRAPELPRQEDYTLDPETDDDEGTEPDIDSFNEAIEEYKAEKEDYDRLIEQGAMLKGLLVTEREFKPCVFSPDAPTPGSPAAATVTAAAVQAAIKAGTATLELLEAEIARINTREARTRELDREKVQEAVHAALFSQTTGETGVDSLTEADQTVLRLLLVQSMDYDTKQQVMDKLFPGLFKLFAKENEELYDSLSRLTESQCSYLTRMALLGKPESKSPGTESAYFLYQVAKSAGVDTTAIEQAQQQKADTRRERQQEKIESLQKKINKLRPAA